MPMGLRMTAGEADDVSISGRREALRLASATSAALFLRLGAATLEPSPVSAADNGKVALVLGASGNIGQALCQQLLKDGYKVRGLTRDPKEKQAMSSKVKWFGDVEWVGGDLKKPETLPVVVKGADKIIFAAGAHAYNPEEGGIINNELIFSKSVGVLADLAKKEGKVSLAWLQQCPQNSL